MSNRHSHHLATRKAQEATQTKPSSRRRDSERTKRHQTNTTHALGARTTEGATISPNTTTFVLPLISGCHTVWGCFVNFSRSRKQSKSSKKPETSEKIGNARRFLARAFAIFPKFRVSSLICFASLILKIYKTSPHSMAAADKWEYNRGEIVNCQVWSLQVLL